MGSVSNILGVSIERDGLTGSLTLSQRRYASDILKKFGMSNCKPVTTPIESNTKIFKRNEPQSEQEIKEMKSKPYKELVGSLLYLSQITRPDLSFAASALSQFCSNPGITHWQLAKRVLRYIKGTVEYGITYKKNDKNMCAYADADWGSDVDN